MDTTLLFQILFFASLILLVCCLIGKIKYDMDINFIMLEKQNIINKLNERLGTESEDVIKAKGVYKRVVEDQGGLLDYIQNWIGSHIGTEMRTVRFNERNIVYYYFYLRFKDNLPDEVKQALGTFAGIVESSGLITDRKEGAFCGQYWKEWWFHEKRQCARMNRCRMLASVQSEKRGILNMTDNEYAREMCCINEIISAKKMVSTIPNILPYKPFTEGAI